MDRSQRSLSPGRNRLHRVVARVLGQSVISGNARSAVGLAFLALTAVILAGVFSVPGDQVLAFSSPSSPIETPASPVRGPTKDTSTPVATGVAVTQARSYVPIPAATSAAPSPDWSLPLGIGLIVLGLALVVGGLFYLLRA